MVTRVGGGGASCDSGWERGVVTRVGGGEASSDVRKVRSMWLAYVLSNCPRTSFCSVGRSTAHTDSRHGPLQEEQDRAHHHTGCTRSLNLRLTVSP